MEDGIKGNSDAIAKIAAAVVNQIVNDPNKIASMAALYSVKQQVDQQNSDITAVESNLKSGIISKYTTIAGGTNYLDVKFDTPFTSMPRVVVSIAHEMPDLFDVSVVNTSTTGFRIYVHSSHNYAADISVSWIAIAT